MQDLDANDITDAVIAQMADTPDPRLREIMDAAVRHLHAFAREVNLTPEEWLQGIATLTAVGQACTPYRQEFILLSDVLGLSASGQCHARRQGTRGGRHRDQPARSLLSRGSAHHRARRHHRPCAQRPRDPAFRPGHRFRRPPVPHAKMDFWQTGADGLYDLQAHDPTVMDMRGQLRCDAEGRYHLRSVKPIGYPIPMDGPVGALVTAQARHGVRPAHIHVLVSAPGYRELVTALYFADDPHVDSDTVFGVAASLVIQDRTDHPDAPIPGIPAIRYDFTLSQDTGSGGGRVGSDPSRLVPAG